MPADLQADFTAAILSAAKDAPAAYQGINMGDAKAVEVENLQEFRDKVKGVYDETGNRIGADIVAEARKLALT